MTRLLKPSSPPRGRFILASGLGATLLAAGAIGQVSPGTGAEASAGGADRSASPNTRATSTESQGQGSQPSPERVIVTGSFIPTAEGEGALPVAVFTADDLRKQGSNSAAEGLRRLPSFFGNASTEADSNGGNGQAGVNLRALGQQNVLILLNGHRAGNPSLLSGFTDANSIPFGAIDHIEVLKDGASATYGSDAVAGVVNYIFKTQYEGAQVDLYYGNTTNNDASTFRGSAITGFSTKDKRFNIVVNANYFHQNSIESKDRFLSSQANVSGNTYAATPSIVANFPTLVGQPIRGVLNLGGPNGNSGTYPGRITVNAAGAAIAGAASLVLRDNVPNGTANSPTVPASLADYRPYSVANGDGFNFRLQTPAIPEQERFAYYGATDYQLIEKAMDLYAFGLYSNNRQYNALASSPGAFGNFAIDPTFNPALAAQFGTERNLIRASPYNPAGATLNTVSYRTFENGRRLSGFDTRFYYGALGVKGELLRTFNYDVTYLHQEDKQIRTDGGDARRSFLLREIATGAFNPFIGGSAPNAGTVNGSSYDNAAALARSAYIAQAVFFNNLNLIESRLSNTFFPDAPQGGVSLAVGAEYRREAFDQQNDAIEQSGDTFGFTAGASFHAVQDVRSIFGEMRFPIVIPTMKVPGIYNLAFTVAGRYQKFFLNGQDPISVANGAPRGVTPTFETTNPKYAFEYQPVQDVKFRGSYSTAFRAPSLLEFFQPAVAGADFPQITDPYALQPQGPVYQPLNGDTTGGNANLTPETTDSYSIGLVVTPRWIKGLTATVDYYQLNQKQVIISGANIAQFVVQQNFNTSNKAYFPGLGFAPGTPNGGVLFNDPAAAFANRIVRDDTNGSLLSIDETPLNAARRSVEGIDVSVFYELDTLDLFKRDFGKFNFNVLYNHVFRFNAQVSPGQGFTDFTGTFSSAPLTPGSIPYNKAQFQFEYQKNIGPGLLDFVATVNYIGDFLDDGGALNGSAQVVDPTTGNPLDPANPVFSRNRKVREYTSLDLQLSYTFKAPEPLTTTASKDYKGKAVASAPARGASLWQKILGGTTLTVGCNDVFDTPPPFAAGAFNDNYDTSLYSIRNRFVYGAISKKF